MNVIKNIWDNWLWNSAGAVIATCIVALFVIAYPQEALGFALFVGACAFVTLMIVNICREWGNWDKRRRDERDALRLAEEEARPKNPHGPPPPPPSEPSPLQPWTLP